MRVAVSRCSVATHDADVDYSNVRISDAFMDELADSNIHFWRCRLDWSIRNDIKVILGSPLVNCTLQCRRKAHG